MPNQFWPNSTQVGVPIPTSPSTLREQRHTMMKGRPSQRARFNFDNVIGSPFLLTTISIAMIGWAIAFVASIAANLKDPNFSHFAWWAVMYQLAVNLGVTTSVLYRASENYQMAICAFLASGLSFSTSTANALIYSSSGPQDAAAAGHILLSIVNIVWIIYFGSTQNARPHAWVDSYSIDHGPAVPGGPRPMSNANSIYPSGRYGTPYPKSVIDAHVSQAPGVNSFLSPTSPMTQMSASPDLRHSDMTHGKSERDTMDSTGSIMPSQLEFTYRARAIYSYEANAEDPNEISFAKGEILEVADISGKWFQAKNSHGEVGIAPSNYLTLISMDS